MCNREQTSSAPSHLAPDYIAAIMPLYVVTGINPAQPWRATRVFARYTAPAIAIAAITALATMAVLAATDGATAQTVNQPPDTMAARVEACTPCHGNKGEGTSDVYFPRLAGKPAGYLYNQLLAFRNGAAQIPADELPAGVPARCLSEEMAEYFAARDPPLPAARAARRQHGNPGARRAAGRRRAIRAAAFPPACSCHGPGLDRHGARHPRPARACAPATSARSSAAWRYGTRTANAPDCMQIVAGHLTEADVKAVAACARRRGPRPTNAAPAPKAAYALPFALRQPAELRRRTMRFDAASKRCCPSLLVAAASRSTAAAQQQASKPATIDRQRGEYLARAGDCIACHTAPEGRLFAGGRADADAVRHALHLEHHARSARPASAGGPPTTSTR